MSETARPDVAGAVPQPGGPAVPAAQPPPAAGEAAAGPATADLFPDLPPLLAERLPPNFRKHVDPASPVPVRGMAAKGLVPLGPSDMCHCLAMLAGDADPGVAASAKKTAAGLPDRILSSALRDETLSPRVLQFFADALAGKDGQLEFLLLNNTTHDLTVAQIVAATTSPRLIEIVSNNQLRLLREERVLRGLLGNPSTSKAVKDGTCDFAVRSGLVLADLPEMVEAHVRVFGQPPAPPQSAEAIAEQQNSAQAVLEEFASELKDQSAPPLEEGKRLNLTQRVLKMNVSEKIKLATLGNKEARGILMRDPNKLVGLAVINSPRITDGEVLGLANSKTCQDDVLRVIYMSREWTRQYPMRLALVKNPKVPLAISMRMLTSLRESEIKELAKDKNVPSGVRLQAKKLSEQKK